MSEPTTRAYTLKLSGDGDWRHLLWKTHVAVNRMTWIWGDWLLTLRGGLPPSLAEDQPDRRVLLALSWMSVESPWSDVESSLSPHDKIVASGRDTPSERQCKVLDRFRAILGRLNINDQQAWIESCEPALCSRIRDDAVWVDRSACFDELQQACRGLTSEWAMITLFDFLGGEAAYFRLPDDDEAAVVEAKDFVQKAGGWLSRNWGSGKKSDSGAIGIILRELARVDSRRVVAKSGHEAVRTLVAVLGGDAAADDTPEANFKLLKQLIGWKGRSSKGAVALEKLRQVDRVSSELWKHIVEKLTQEAADQAGKAGSYAARPPWMADWRAQIEDRMGVPYRTSRDLIWEHGVALDHALRRVSAAHTWIKRAEAERRKFKEATQAISQVPPLAVQWLDRYCQKRGDESGATEEFFIRNRAIDGWDKVVQGWSELGENSTRQQRIEAVRMLQANLDDNEKFGDVQLFAGFGDDDREEAAATRMPCLADDDAVCIWRELNGRPTAAPLKQYVEARIAERDQQRFKVPAYRHPDPLRAPVYVDYGNSRWNIEYSLLAEAQARAKCHRAMETATSEKTIERAQQKLAEKPDLRGLKLDVWDGETVHPLEMRWHSKRLTKDLDLSSFDKSRQAPVVTRADRLGRIAGDQNMASSVNILEVFEQKDWNGRLQAPRDQLNQLADRVYGKRAAPMFAKLDEIASDQRTRRLWERLDWFITTSAKLQPKGPWLDDYVPKLPDGVQYRKGRTGYYLDYAANKDRKGRARLLLARLPGLRILSFDLGHRFAAACAVWETLSSAAMEEEIAGREIVAGGTGPNDRYCHVAKPTGKVVKRGRKKGQPVVESTIYRRIGADHLPDGGVHPAPWARLDRQFLIKLQGEDRPARASTDDEIRDVNDFRCFLGLQPITDRPRIADLQRDVVKEARRGIRRFGDAARIAFAMTAKSKPISGGREIDFAAQPTARVEYVQDQLATWLQLTRRDKWAKAQWTDQVVPLLEDEAIEPVTDDLPRPTQKKLQEAVRAKLEPAARKLADPESTLAKQLQAIWAARWANQEAEWRRRLRWLRRFILPRKKDHGQRQASIRRVGGLSVKRLQTIRDLYQLLKSFRMRPEPDNLRRNIPKLHDDMLANFGRRILNQLERLREQRIKQLASRVVEAALGAGRMKKPVGRDLKRPQRRVDAPCHVVVAENLERYRPEENRLRRENRQLMDWAARNVRKHIVEGCELHGLHFVEVSPAYTSRQDSRTGSPGTRCEDISRAVFGAAVRRRPSTAAIVQGTEGPAPNSKFDREVMWLARDLGRIQERKTSGEKLGPRERVLDAWEKMLDDLPASLSTIRVPRRGGEIFVSASSEPGSTRGIQADLNAAANIGLKALSDPDWPGGWWFVLVNASTGLIVREKVQGTQALDIDRPCWLAKTADETVGTQKEGAKKSAKHAKGTKTNVYAWKQERARHDVLPDWTDSTSYWEEVDLAVAKRLEPSRLESENPF